MADYPVFTTPERRNVSMQDARLQANDELGALYERALQNIQTSVADSQTQAAEQAAARGMGSSGLSQDAMNKIAIAGLSQGGNLEAERAQKIAALSRQILERDQDLGFRERQQEFNEWSGQQNMRMDQDRFHYQKENDLRNYDFDREKFGYQQKLDDQNYSFDREKFQYGKDKDWRDYTFDVSRFNHQIRNDDRNYGLDVNRFNHTVKNDDRNYNLDVNRFNHTVTNDNRNYGLDRERFNYGREKDTRDYNYQVSRDNVTDNHWQQDYNYRSGRDSVSDNRWQKEFTYRSGRDGVADSHWQQEYNLKKQTAASRSSGGGGGSSSGGSSTPRFSADKFTREDIQYSANPQNAPYANVKKPTSNPAPSFAEALLKGTPVPSLLQKFGLKGIR